ncbi:MAG: hypothetical protein LPJ98_13695 [Cyclobacteriaceae bacterium]|nr:hypothetical protein [Cyclobacteriaceae bacterium]
MKHNFSPDNNFEFRAVFKFYKSPFAFVEPDDFIQVDQMGIVNPEKIMGSQELLKLLKCFCYGKFLIGFQVNMGIVAI